ncbi:MAG: acyl carrier protein [Candidatus Marinimicrobia bacterium]|nr:acyl carrier protein [Candidatus Neomarinimicrobiota bacterium]
MNEELILKKTIRIIKENFPGMEIVNEDTNFKEDLEMDSLDFVETVMKIEDGFEIKIEDKEGEKLKTVKDLVTLIKSKL